MWRGREDVYVVILLTAIWVAQHLFRRTPREEQEAADFDYLG
jgi:hypothetical protein